MDVFVSVRLYPQPNEQHECHGLEKIHQAILRVFLSLACPAHRTDHVAETLSQVATSSSKNSTSPNPMTVPSFLTRPSNDQWISLAKLPPRSTTLLSISDPSSTFSSRQASST